MKAILVSLSVSIFIILIVLSGCNSVDDRFIGTWIDEGNEEATYTFLSDGTFSSNDYFGPRGTWEIQDNRLILKNESEDIVYLSARFTFSEGNNKLTLIPVDSGDTLVLIKQR